MSDKNHQISKTLVLVAFFVDRSRWCALPAVQEYEPKSNRIEIELKPKFDYRIEIELKSNRNRCSIIIELDNYLVETEIEISAKLKKSQTTNRLARCKSVMRFGSHTLRVCKSTSVRFPSKASSRALTGGLPRAQRKSALKL